MITAAMSLPSSLPGNSFGAQDLQDLPHRTHSFSISTMPDVNYEHIRDRFYTALNLVRPVSSPPLYEGLTSTQPQQQQKTPLRASNQEDSGNFTPETMVFSFDDLPSTSDEEHTGSLAKGDEISFPSSPPSEDDSVFIPPHLMGRTSADLLSSSLPKTRKRYGI